MSTRQHQLEGVCVAIVLALTTFSAQAHSGIDAGWLHPLTGLDHFLAMVAVGAWSAQIGGRAIWLVPGAFVLCMFCGGLLGMSMIDLQGLEVGITLSVIALGAAIALHQRMPTVVAALGVGLFGMLHGYAHGYEMPVIDDKVGYTLGFLATTATLHLVGAFGALGLMRVQGGGKILRGLGLICSMCGGWILFSAVANL